MPARASGNQINGNAGDPPKGLKLSAGLEAALVACSTPDPHSDTDATKGEGRLCGASHSLSTPAQPYRALSPGRTALGLGLLVLATFGAASMAAATDEIQVYDASIAEPGQLTLQQHLNYAISGRRVPDFPGGLVSNHSLNGTPELAYGVTDWYEVGLYAPFAVSNHGTFFSDGVKIRQLFVSPHADQREFFYGVNFELSYATPQFAQTKIGLEIRPIIGVRKDDWEFIVNPIIDSGFGRRGETHFAPAVRVARKVSGDVALGVEYYSDLGRITGFSRLQEQQHALFGVIDFKVGKIDVDFGIGYGFTKGSDKLVVKTIIGTAL